MAVLYAVVAAALVVVMLVLVMMVAVAQVDSVMMVTQAFDHSLVADALSLLMLMLLMVSLSQPIISA